MNIYFVFWSFWLLFCYRAPMVYFCYVWYFVLSFFHRSFCLALFKPGLLIPIRLFWTDSDPNLKKARLRILFLVWIPRCKIPLESNISCNIYWDKLWLSYTIITSLIIKYWMREEIRVNRNRVIFRRTDTDPELQPCFKHAWSPLFTEAREKIASEKLNFFVSCNRGPRGGIHSIIYKWLI